MLRSSGLGFAVQESRSLTDEVDADSLQFMLHQLLQGLFAASDEMQSPTRSFQIECDHGILSRRDPGDVESPGSVKELIRTGCRCPAGDETREQTLVAD